jgi:DNA-directed RNA polymerase specialized sigma24 family protein
VTADKRIVRILQGMAARLTSDTELQKDLIQEMLIHLAGVDACRSGQKPSWYLQSCQFHARNYLVRGRSVDSIKRQNKRVLLEQNDSDGDTGFGVDAVDPMDIHSELVTRDIIDRLLPHLTDAQQQILFLLLHGFGVCEIARLLRVSHPAVVKQRKRIARHASALLMDSGCVRLGGAVAADP